MAIIRLEDKYKSKYKLQLTPERHYISSSSGITGSVYVFPNRSETQKDNVDERLNLAPMVEEGTEFSGKPIRAYDSNSLEARREEIYKGELNKFIGGPFTDAIQYEYTHGTTTQTGELWNDQIEAGTVTVNPNDIYVRTHDNRNFSYTSNGEWITYPEVFRKLPESDRDRSALKYDVALGMLLDGTHPFTEDHAWRSSYLYPGNSSFTSASTPAQKAEYQFTGLDIFTDELGIPYLDSPVLSKERINPWPPEIAAQTANVISNWMLSGYSDLSMHPRNATKKEIKLLKANHDLFSSGSAAQRIVANRLTELNAFEEGWWTHNFQCLSLHETTNYKPFLAYDNTNNQYDIDWSSASVQVTFEFWIKPCKEQSDVGVIAHVDNNWALAIIPDTTTTSNGVSENYKIAFYHNTGADKATAPATTDVTTSGSKYVTGGVLSLDNWHHVMIRFGRNFNNGQMNVYIDGRLLDSLDGVKDPSIGRTGNIDVTVSPAKGDTLLVGGYYPSGGVANLWGVYADKQDNLRSNTSTPTYANGAAVACEKQLKSELSELRVWSTSRTNKELDEYRNKSLTTTSNMLLYIPFLFNPIKTTSIDSPQWNRLGFLPDQDNPENEEAYYKNGSYLEINNTNLQYNKTQFCTNSAYIVGMPFVNVHTHLQEYVNNLFPVIGGGYPDLTITDTSAAIAAYPVIDNESTRETNAVVPEVYTGLEYFQKNWTTFEWLRSINSIMLPCDNPKFDVDATICADNMNKFLQKEYLKLNGSTIASTSDEYEIKHFYDDEDFAIQNTIIKTDPSKKVFKGKVENYQTATLVSENKLEDNDFLSPISTILSVPQIYYGNRIHPGSIELTFKTVSDKEITIVDLDGVLYRKNTRHDNTPCKVGHVDYGNGLLCIFSPLLTEIGLTNYDVKFKGEKNLHVMQLDIPCDAGVANISQHPTYKKLRPTGNANESDGNVTFISTIYLHDENLNIIGKVNLAQPVQKREEDSFIFRVKLDF